MASDIMTQEATPVPAVTDTTPPTLTHDISNNSNDMDHTVLLDLLRHQLDFYFSKDNLAVDAFLVSQMNAERMVPIDVIVSFKRVQQLTNNIDDIVDAVKLCHNCTLDSTSTYIKATPQATRNTLILRDLNADTTEQDILNAFNSDNSPAKDHVLSVTAETNDTWYVVLSNETITQATAEWCVFDAPQINGQPIHARVKNESILRGVYVNSVTAPAINPMQSNMYSPTYNQYNDMYAQQQTYDPSYIPHITDQQFSPYNYNYQPLHNNTQVGGSKKYPHQSPSRGTKPRKQFDNNYNSNYNRTFDEVTAFSDAGSVTGKPYNKLNKKKHNKQIHVPVSHSTIVQHTNGNEVNGFDHNAFPALPDTSADRSPVGNGHTDNDTINGKSVHQYTNGHTDNNTQFASRNVSGDSMNSDVYNAADNTTQHSDAFDFTKSNSIFGKFDANTVNGNSDTTFNNHSINDTPSINGITAQPIAPTPTASTAKTMSFAAALTSLPEEEVARRAKVVEDGKRAKQAAIDAEKRRQREAQRSANDRHPHSDADRQSSTRTQKLSVKDDNSEKPKYRAVNNEKPNGRSVPTTPANNSDNAEPRNQRFERFSDDKVRSKQSNGQTATQQHVSAPSWAELAKKAATTVPSQTTQNGHTEHSTASTSVENSTDDRSSNFSTADTSTSWRRGD